MSNETLFRVTLALLAIVLYVNHHVIQQRRIARSTVSRHATADDKWLIAPAWLWTVSLALYIAGFRWFDHGFPAPAWLRWSGVAAMLACVPLSQWTYRELGAHFSKKLELMSGHRLIRSGPYRFVRHPMYATLFLCAIATCLISANYFVIGSVALVAITFQLRIRKEEAMLVERFGDEYREYQRQTWALVPKFATMF